MMGRVIGTGAARSTPWPEVAALAGFGVLTLALTAGVLLDLDVAVRDWCDTHQVKPLHVAARGLIVLGSGNVLAPVALALALVVAVRTRSGWPVLPVLAAVVAGNLVLVPLKMLFDRAAPHSPVPDPVLLFHHPPGWSYPSGHAANSVYFFGLLAMLLDRTGRAPLGRRTRRAIRVVPPVVVCVVFAYLGYHWLTDLAAGLLLGVFLDRLLQRVPGQTGAPAPTPVTSRPG